MSSLHKDFDHALSRIGTYLNGQTGHDDYTNVKANITKEALKLDDGKNLSLKVLRNQERFGVLETLILPENGMSAWPDA